MKKNRKITLFPTQLAKNICPDALGTAFLSLDQQTISLNLYNLPKPDQFTIEKERCDCYRAWLYNPALEKIVFVGDLIPSGDGLFTLYDIPLRIEEGLTELLITHEQTAGKTPAGEILLIGYLAESVSQPLERFEPFSKPLSFHQWWKVEAKSKTTALNNCQFCPYWQRYCWPQAPVIDDDFDLPEIIGFMADPKSKLQYLVHGLPGRLLKSSQPEQGKTGYLYWHPYYGVPEKLGAIGYWLCYINPVTNKIVTPLGVTIPPG